MVANFFLAGRLEALGILLRTFAVGLEGETAGEVAWVAMGGTGDGTPPPLGAIGIVDEGGFKAGLTGG